MERDADAARRLVHPRRPGPSRDGRKRRAEVFARFEGANGEYGAHEFLEETSEDNYEGFEEGGLVVMNEGLRAGDVEAARGGWEASNTNLREATGGYAVAASVHTFETSGTHEYFCVPHEAAGMVGTVIVE